MSGIDVSKYKNYKAPLPCKGKVVCELRVQNCEGSQEDANGEKSRGLLLDYTIVGPDAAIMNDGGSALGFKFTERVWVPRKSLEDRDPATAGRMNTQVAQRLGAMCGGVENIPEGELDDAALKAYDGVLVDVAITTGFDEFAGGDIVKVQKAEPHKSEAV